MAGPGVVGHDNFGEEAPQTTQNQEARECAVHAARVLAQNGAALTQELKVDTPVLFTTQPARGPQIQRRVYDSGRGPPARAEEENHPAPGDASTRVRPLTLRARRSTQRRPECFPLRGKLLNSIASTPTLTSCRRKSAIGPRTMPGLLFW